MRNEKGQFIKGHPQSNTGRTWLKKGHSLNKGRKLSEEHKRKVSRIGDKLSEETKNKIRKAMTGKRHTEESKRKMGVKGELNYNWQGGLSFEEYTIDWTVSLRRTIRERDHYTCRVCGIQQGDTALDIHHIDYNKKNCNPDNLITLCRKCHIKTNFNRNYWTNYFYAKN